LSQQSYKIHDLQKNIYRYMRQKARGYEGELPRELKSYRTNMQRLSKRDFADSDFKELMKSIHHSSIVYLGDFHTFDQSSRNLQRLVKNLVQKKKKLILGVEFVQYIHQERINQYLNHHITEFEFLESINYKESWRFPWYHYRVFFELARQNKLKIVALNSHGGLKERDQFASDLLVEHIYDNPDAIFLVLFGEYHIARNKLPKCVERKIPFPIRQTIIHQNLDQVYWNMEDKQKKPTSQIIKFNESEFSLQTSPPWIKYESMIHWYENLIEDPSFELHNYMLETGFMALNSSVPDTFVYVCQQLSKTLNFKVSKLLLEDFNIYDHQNMDFVLGLVNQLPQKNLVKHFSNSVIKGKKFKIPFARNYYCSSYSINRISFLAGLHLLDLFQAGHNENYEKILLGKDQTQKFIFLCYQMMMGYFSSKLINPYRKCDLYMDIVRRLHSPLTPNYVKKDLRITKRVLDLTDTNSTEELHFILKGTRLSSLYQCAKNVGYILGDFLFDSHYKKSDREFSQTINYLQKGDFEVKQFQKMLRKLLPTQNYRKSQKRLF